VESRQRFPEEQGELLRAVQRQAHADGERARSEGRRISRWSIGQRPARSRAGARDRAVPSGEPVPGLRARGRPARPPYRPGGGAAARAPDEWTVQTVALLPWFDVADRSEHPRSREANRRRGFRAGLL